MFLEKKLEKFSLSPQGLCCLPGDLLLMSQGFSAGVPKSQENKQGNISSIAVGTVTACSKREPFMLSCGLISSDCSVFMCFFHFYLYTALLSCTPVFCKKKDPKSEGKDLGYQHLQRKHFFSSFKL